MSAESEKHAAWLHRKKLDNLSVLCDCLCSFSLTGNAEFDVRAEAAALAHELFPPMAKALAWQVSGDDICSQRIDGNWYRIRSFPSACPSDDLLINCALCGNGLADSLQWCATIDEAKAWCESRNQTKFREQLA